MTREELINVLRGEGSYPLEDVDFMWILESFTDEEINSNTQQQLADLLTQRLEDGTVKPPTCMRARTYD